MPTLPSTVRCGNRPPCWMTYPIARRSSCAGTLETSSPSTVMRPLVGSVRRLIIRSVVVLPDPELPTRATISPAAIDSDRSSTATVRSAPSPNVFVT